MEEIKNINIDYTKTRMSPSLSVPNFNKNKKDFISNDLNLNMNYLTIKKDNNEYSPNITYMKKNDDNNELNYNTIYLNNSKYKEFIYNEGDDYEKLVMKNKNLKRLFEQVNSQLLKSLKKQHEMEKKKKNKKKKKK